MLFYFGRVFLLTIIGIIDANFCRDDEAEALLRDALRVLERTVGPNHFDVAAALNNLAAIRQRHEAEGLYRRALAIPSRSASMGDTIRN